MNKFFRVLLGILGITLVGFVLAGNASAKGGGGGHASGGHGGSDAAGHSVSVGDVATSHGSEETVVSTHGDVSTVRVVNPTSSWLAANVHAQCATDASGQKTCTADHKDSSVSALMVLAVMGAIVLVFGAAMAAAAFEEDVVDFFRNIMIRRRQRHAAA